MHKLTTLDERIQTSKFERVCDYCGKPIRVGDTYVLVVRRDHGVFDTQENHEECYQWSQ